MNQIIDKRKMAKLWLLIITSLILSLKKNPLYQILYL